MYLRRAQATAAVSVEKNGAPAPPANKTISPSCMYSMLFLVSYRSPTP